MASIIGYRGYIPAYLTMKGIHILDKQIDKRDKKIAEIDDRTQANKQRADELAQRTDKASKKEWKKEFGKDIKRVVNLSEDINDLDKIRESGEKIIYKVANPLIAKRIRMEKQISNLDATIKSIETKQEEIKAKIEKTDKIDEKGALKSELMDLQKKLGKLMKKKSSLERKLRNFMKKIDKMQDIIGDEYDMEEGFNKEMSGTPSNPAPSKPDAGKPDAGKPDAGKPDAGKPDAGKPDAGKPDAGKPDAGKPGAGKPDAGKPDAGKPGAGKPDAGKPDAGKPGAGKPDAGKPDAGKPDAGKPDAGKPGAGKPGAGKPDAGKPGADKPEPKDPSKNNIDSKSQKTEEINQEEKESLGKKIKNALSHISNAAKRAFEKIFKRNKVRKLSRRDIDALNGGMKNQEPTTFAEKRQNFMDKYSGQNIDNQTAIGNASEKAKQQQKEDKTLRKCIKKLDIQRK